MRLVSVFDECSRLIAVICRSSAIDVIIHPRNLDLLFIAYSGGYSIINDIFSVLPTLRNRGRSINGSCELLDRCVNPRTDLITSARQKEVLSVFMS